MVTIFYYSLLEVKIRNDFINHFLYKSFVIIFGKLNKEWFDWSYELGNSYAFFLFVSTSSLRPRLRLHFRFCLFSSCEG